MTSEKCPYIAWTFLDFLDFGGFYPQKRPFFHLLSHHRQKILDHEPQKVPKNTPKKHLFLTIPNGSHHQPQKVT